MWQRILKGVRLRCGAEGSRPETVDSWWPRWRSLVVLIFLVVPVTLFRPYKSHPPILEDGVGYHLWTRAILEGDISFRRYGQHSQASGLYLSDPARAIYQNKYPPGVALLRLPIMAFLVNRKCVDPLISPAEHWASQVCGALALLGTCLLLLRICVLLALDRACSHLAVFTTVLGTGLFHYGTYDAGMSHIYSALVGTFLLWLGVRALVPGRPGLPVVGTVGACLLLVLLRNTNVLLLGGMTIAYLAGRRVTQTWAWRRVGRDLAVVLAGAGSGGALQMAYNHYASGRWTLSSYGGEEFVWQRPMQLAVLFSYERGLFTYYPLVAVALLAGLVVRRTRYWAAWFGAVLLAVATLYGYWGCWTLGTSFGYRGLVEVLPGGAVLFAAALADLTGWRRGVFAMCAWLCVVATLELMLGFWTWHLAGDKDLGGLYWQHLVGSRSLLWFLN